ncbi:MAG: PEP-CTERM sorting domain-containing protein, partial [Pirellulaceae bacterium]
ETVSGFIGDPTRIRFLAHGSSGFSTIDNVRGTFVSAVPEPGSLVPALLAALAIVSRRRRFRAQVKKTLRTKSDALDTRTP